MSSKHLLITGGAGYIGSHQVRYLLARGVRVTVIDNLSQGARDFVPSEATFYKGDVSDSHLLEHIFAKDKIDGVIHFAGASCVAPSVTDPLHYYQNNVFGTMALLKVMKQCGIRHLVFSSSAAVYGDPLSIPIPEDHPLRPVSPYGWTKRMIEQILADCERAYGLKYVALRYFNAAGAIEDGTLGESHVPESHLIPLVLTAVRQRTDVSIYGDDYPTRDGTCVRDFVHVMDLADAHWMAFQYLVKGGESTAINLGSGKGYSVREIIQMVEKITGKIVLTRLEERRAGDVSELVADSSLARQKLHWSPRLGLEKILVSAWNWETQR
ncbi:MAG: UDP-glucose 4-epimerase GalE [Deltaproteobacteria bacterium]|nr:UDP-glucose 4-epimerase GalE [Deltaproteobacteria bacterium]